MITKRVEYGKIEILPNGQIQLRLDTVIEEDGIELLRSYHRSVAEPGADLSDHAADPRIAAVAAVLWTPDVVSTFTQAQAAAQAAVLSPVKV